MSVNYIVDLDAPSQYEQDLSEVKAQVIEQLEELHKNRNRTTYIHLVLEKEGSTKVLNGIATSGSISVDGTSALRRTCNLTCSLEDGSLLEAQDWCYNSNVQVWTGLSASNAQKLFAPEDEDDLRYVRDFITEADDSDGLPWGNEDIVWLKQGVFVINSFSAQETTNNWSISLSGRDYMARLNGDVGGTYAVEEILNQYEDANGITQKLNLKSTIERIVRTFYPNVSTYIDIPATGKKLLRYIGDNPFYLLMTEEYTDNPWYPTRPVTIGTLFGEQTIVYNKKKTALEKCPTGALVSLSDNKEYTLKILNYGDEAGYQDIELFYPTELKVAVGDTAVSALDKIKALFTDYEYFFDTNGAFVFQQKESAQRGNSSYSFLNADLLTSISLTASLNEFKNDFVIWGKKSNGASILTHYVYDEKPNYYYSWKQKKTYFTSECEKEPVAGWILAPWQELIYQMALDDASSDWRVYYPEVKQFWRQIYDPEPPTYEKEVDSLYVPQTSLGESSLKRYELERVKNNAQYDYRDKELFMYEKDYWYSWRDSYSKIFDLEAITECIPFNNLYFLKENNGEEEYVNFSFAELGFNKEKGVRLGTTESTAKTALEKLREFSLDRDDVMSWCHDLLVTDAVENSILNGKLLETVKITSGDEWFAFKNSVSDNGSYKIFGKIMKLSKSGVLSSVKWSNIKNSSFQDTDDCWIGYRANRAVFDREWDLTIKTIKDEYPLDKLQELLVLNFSFPYIYLYDTDLSAYQNCLSGSFGYMDKLRAMNNLYYSADGKNYKNYWEELFLRSLIYAPTEKKLVQSGSTNYIPLYRNYLGERETNEVGKYFYKYVVDCCDYDPATHYTYTPETDRSYKLEFIDRGRFNVQECGRRTQLYKGDEITSLVLADNTNSIKLSSSFDTGLFADSIQGKTGEDAAQEMITTYAPDIVSLNLTTVPLYYLQPNKKLFLTGIVGMKDGVTIPFNGVYGINKFTIPLSHNGTSSITLTTKLTDPYVDAGILYNVLGSVDKDGIWTLKASEAIVSNGILEVK